MNAPARGRFAVGRWLILLLLCSLAGLVQADVFRPAYLELREAGDGRYDVFWKVPAQDANTRLALSVVMPAGTQTVGESRTVFSGNALTERWQVRRPGGMVGQKIRIEGSAVGVTDVIARVQRQDGTSQLERLSAHPAGVVAAVGAAAADRHRLHLPLGASAAASPFWAPASAASARNLALARVRCLLTLV